MVFQGVICYFHKIEIYEFKKSELFSCKKAAAVFLQVFIVNKFED